MWQRNSKVSLHWQVSAIRKKFLQLPFDYLVYLKVLSQLHVTYNHMTGWLKLMNRDGRSFNLFQGTNPKFTWSD